VADSTATSTSVNVFAISAFGVTPTIAYPGSNSTSSQTLPVIRGDGHSLFIGEIPMLEASGVAYSGSVAHSSLAVLLPLVGSIAGSHAGSSSEPILKLRADGEGLPQRLGRSNLNLLAITSESAGTSPIIQKAQSHQTIPAITSESAAAADRFASSSAPVKQLTAAGTAWTVEVRSAESSQKLPKIVAESAGGTERLGASAATLKAISGAGAGTTTGVVATGDSVGVSNVTVLSFSGSADGLLNRLAGSAQALPTITGQGVAGTDRFGVSDAALPAVTGSGAAAYAFSRAQSIVKGLAITGSGAAISGSRATSAQALPIMQAQSAAGAVWAQSAVTLPIIQIEAAAYTDRAGTSIAVITVPIGDGIGLSGSIAASEIELPIITAQSLASFAAGGVSILTLPAWLFNSVATGGQPVPGANEAAAQGQGFALDTVGNALTEYAGVNFNSYAWMGNVLLAANEDGLFVIGGATDNSVAIDASMAFPINPSDAQLRRLSKLVVGYRNDGDLRLTVSADGGENYEYVLEETGRDECHPNRVRIGKGIKGKYWTMTIENIGGADFAVDTLDADWEVLSRRVP
jgi:hypothetical protein